MIVGDTYDFVCRDEYATRETVSKPGYFNEHRGELKIGAVLHCRLGHPRDGVEFGDVQVICCPVSEAAGDVEVSVGPFTKFEVAGYADSPEKEQEKAA